MTGLESFPYLTPQSDRVKAKPWMLSGVDAVASPDNIRPPLLPHWDPSVHVCVSRTVEVDVDGVRTDCGLGPDDVLRLAALWYSPGTRLRGRGSAVDMDGYDSTVTADLRIEICGEMLADRVLVESHLILCRVGGGGQRLAPRKPGSLLWRDSSTILLEGAATRFPVELVDFSAHPWLPDDAAWYLDWDPSDLDQMALGSMRLLVNSAHRAVRDAVTSSSPDTAGRAIISMIRFDVARTMITGALNNDDFVRAPGDFPDGSVGAAARRLIQTRFPRSPFEGLRQRAREAPSRLECELQAATRLLREV